VRALLLVEALPETVAPRLRAQLMLAIDMLDGAVAELGRRPGRLVVSPAALVGRAPSVRRTRIAQIAPMVR
jgi:hypothetical protein